MPASPLVDTEVHVTEAIIKALVDAGVDTVFGLSGGNTGRIFSGEEAFAMGFATRVCADPRAEVVESRFDGDAVEAVAERVQQRRPRQGRC